jgi:transcriptional regulator with GAF, ATPase, and Fis domain
VPKKSEIEMLKNKDPLLKEDLFHFFRNLDFAEEYSDQELKQLVNVCQLLKWNKNDVIIEEGQMNNSIYFLHKGVAEVLKYDDKSKDFYLINQMEPGALFGEMSEITGEPASARILAKTDCSVLILVRLTSLLKQTYRKLLHTCTRNIVQRLRLMSEKQARRFAAEAELEKKRLMREIGKRDSEIISRTEELQNTRNQLTKLYLQHYEIDGDKHFGEMIGISPAMKNIYDFIRSLSDVNTTVLITGESGTGKGMIAIAIHENSLRNKQAFISVNCATLNDELLASELFGHKKGSFTGAIHDRQGRFEMAEGGTIFLDEIGDVTPRMQAFLLRVIETGEYERVGESKTRKADVRIITATNRDLKLKVSEGSFREDLYYRLNVMNIETPPLRDRKTDIPLLLDHFRKIFNQLLNRNVGGFSREAFEILQDYPWHGNVRELRNVIERSILLCNDSVLKPHHLPKEFLPPVSKSVVNAESALHKSGSDFESEIKPLRKKLNREIILQALTDSNRNVTAAAKQLEISRGHLYRVMKKFNIPIR